MSDPARAERESSEGGRPRLEVVQGRNGQPGAPAPPVGGLQGKWVVLGLVGIGTFMTTLDSSIVNISLPAMARSFGTPLSGTIEWVVIVYLVVIAAVLLTFGRLSDMVGRQPIWTWGLGIFTLGSALCGAAPSLPLLIAARGFQGIGGALIFAPSVALITDAFPARERGRAIGINAVVVSLGVSVGPALGGLITEYLTWRWIFYINVPIGIVGIVGAMKLLRGSHRKSQRFDFLGAFLLGVGLASLTLGLSFGQEWGWTSGRLAASLVVAVVALVALVFVEQRIGSPNVDLALVTCRPFAAALTSLVLSFLALFAVAFLMPFYFENLRGFSPVQSGLLLTAWSLAIAVVAPISGSLADRIGSRWLASGGLAVSCAGLLMLAQLDTRSSVFDIVWRLALIGIGTGLFQSPNNRALMAAAPRTHQGQASGLLGTGRVVGQSLSVALAGAVFGVAGGLAANSALATRVEGAVIPPDQLVALQSTFVGAFHAALLVSAAITAIGIFTSMVRGPED